MIGVPGGRFWIGGPPPFGYSLEQDPAGSRHKVLQINERESGVIREAVFAVCFRDFVSEHGTDGSIHVLNRDRELDGLTVRDQTFAASPAGKAVPGSDYPTQSMPLTIEAPGFCFMSRPPGILVSHPRLGDILVKAGSCSPWDRRAGSRTRR